MLWLHIVPQHNFELLYLVARDIANLDYITRDVVLHNLFSLFVGEKDVDERVSVCVCVFVCVFLYVYMYVCLFVYLYVCMYVCVCVSKWKKKIADQMNCSFCPCYKHKKQAHPFVFHTLSFSLSLSLSLSLSKPAERARYEPAAWSDREPVRKG